jgi:hypothetical protein
LAPQKVEGVSVYLYNTAIILTLLSLIISPTALADDSIGNGSLSEINFNKEESVFFKNIPWSKNDPFVRPGFKSKKSKAVPGKDSIKRKAPKTIKGSKPSDLYLKAILYSDESSSAIIDGRIVRVGSTIKDQKILEINKDSIKVDFNGKVYNIKLKDFSIINDDEN